MKTIDSYNVVKTDGILLNANENSHDLSDEIRSEIIEAIARINFNRYPDTDETELLEAYGKLNGLKSTQLLAGNGSDQMLGYLIGSFLGKGKKLCTLTPDFSMYDYYASSYEADVIRFQTAEDGSFRAEDFIAFAKENKADMILFSNPNNPTGFCASADEIAKIAAAFRDIPVVIDEAYMDFSKEHSSVTLIDQYPSAYVTKTLSKAYGMAGIRIGFLISSEKNMEPLKKAFVPYALNSISMAAACVVLKHAGFFRNQIQDIVSERRRVYDILKDCPELHIRHSEANFLYGSTEKKQRMIEILAAKGITIRDYASSNHFRITIGTKAENDLMLSALKQFLEEL